MKPSYEVLDIEQFGHELIDSGDLDPVYIMLQGMPEPELSRFLVAYWCTYHVGVSAYLAESDERHNATFWQLLGSVAAQGPDPSPVGERWPRGKERRHWRGANAIESWRHLQSRYPDPSHMTDAIRQSGLMTGGVTPFRNLDKFIRSHTGFGPWISFKVGDMAEQVMGVPVNFEQAEVFMFDTPKAAAKLLWMKHTGAVAGTFNIKPKHGWDHAISGVVAHLQETFAEYPAPNGKRRVNLQEIETVLCKWKSHCSGHYPLYNDIGEVAEQLRPWMQHSRIADFMYRRIPQAGRHGRV